ncbi:MAG: hypothetical protein NT099_07630 [Candidatus Saganbacteria bacterium]|nr:hypothetical protein [Candidatus Saganbacteria bacterium]
MKKIGLALVFLTLLSSFSYGLIAGGAKLAGMGGAGTAICDNISAAYYNPAGILGSDPDNPSMKLSIGAPVAGMSDALATFSQVADMNAFLINNYAKTIDINGTTGMIFGMQYQKIGLSVIPESTVLANKTANSYNGSVGANIQSSAALTFGTTWNFPFLPMNFMDVGTNIKYIANYQGSTAITGVTTTAGSANYLYGTGLGWGFDLGAKTGLYTPWFPITVGIMMKDVYTSVGNSTVTRTDTISPDGTVTPGVATTTTSTTITPGTCVIGAATQLFEGGTIVAADYATSMSDGELRLGIEQPIFSDMFIGRAGLISGTQNSKITVGVGFNLFGETNIAYIIDNKNSKDNVVIVGFGI